MINFEAALEALSDAEVNFIVIGAYAAVIQGSAQLTRDLDICYERTPLNIKRLAAAIAPLHPKLRGAPANLPFQFDERTISQGMNFTLVTDVGEIDLLGDISGIGQFPELARDAINISLGNFSVRVASLDAIIRSKRAAARPKDLQVLPELEALKELQKSPKKDSKNS